MSKVVRISNPADRRRPPKRYAVETRQPPMLVWDLRLETDFWDVAKDKYTALCNDPANEKLFIRIVDRRGSE